MFLLVAVHVWVVVTSTKEKTNDKVYLEHAATDTSRDVSTLQIDVTNGRCISLICQDPFSNFSLTRVKGSAQYKIGRIHGITVVMTTELTDHSICL